MIPVLQNSFPVVFTSLEDRVIQNIGPNTASQKHNVTTIQTWTLKRNSGAYWSQTLEISREHQS